MKDIQIEAWAIRVIERVEAGQPDEDSKVELKSEWPIAKKAARRIAAHANAARGEPILWLIGVDEKAHAVIGAGQAEVSTWYDQVKAEFDEQIAPMMRDLNIPYNGKIVVALLFETERFPFVIKAPNGQREVPWREGTSTRSAKRSELLKLLVPLQYLPRFEFLFGEVEIDNAGSTGELYWNVELDSYIEPYDDMRLVIPFHKCTASLEIEGSSVRAELTEIRLSAGLGTRSQTIVSTDDELLVHGPGRVVFRGTAFIPELPSDLNHNLRVSVFVVPVGADQAATLTAMLRKLSVVEQSSSALHVWKEEFIPRQSTGFGGSIH